jgi:hypothetical protein
MKQLNESIESKVSTRRGFLASNFPDISLARNALQRKNRLRNTGQAYCGATALQDCESCNCNFKDVTFSVD